MGHTHRYSDSNAATFPIQEAGCACKTIRTEQALNVETLEIQRDHGTAIDIQTATRAKTRSNHAFGSRVVRKTFSNESFCAAIDSVKCSSKSEISW